MVDDLTNQKRPHPAAKYAARMGHPQQVLRLATNKQFQDYLLGRCFRPFGAPAKGLDEGVHNHGIVSCA